MSLLYRAAKWVIRSDRPSPLLKHFPTVIALAVAMLITVWFGLPMPQPIAVVCSAVVGAGSVALAAWFSRNEATTRWVLAVPLAGLLAVALLRLGTGGATSLFASLMILPIVWIASEDGRRWIAVAGLGTAAAIMLPFAVLGEEPRDATEWLRGVVAPLVYTMVAAVINEMSRQNRSQLRAIRALAEQREGTLAESLAQASQLRESEAELRRANSFTSSVLDAVTVQSIIGTDLTGLVNVWNPGAASMLGRTAEETLGRASILDFHLDDELENRSRELNYPTGATVLNPGFSALVESARLGVAEMHEWTYRRADGSEFPAEVAVTRRVDDRGATTGYIFVATDITQAVEVSRLKDEFVGLVSHELRTPLSSILGYLELMKDDEDAPLSDEQQLYLGVAERNAHRLLGLVGDLLFTAQADSGGFPLAVGEVAVGDVITGAVASARPVADAAGITLESTGVPSDLVIEADRGRLGQAIDNLVSNAIKFTPRGGSVSVGLVEPDGDGPLEITVRDTGMGIPAAELDQLFTRFFRATTATANAVPGVGLGLVITKAIVQAHHGELDVSSVEGEGTVFTLRLPVDARVLS
ncbi:signal transduction histidine kinase [Okibacterium sp. HSC-33S16]|uniref:sensor histidine kinase n=1 Tax=Okibacterium sp. HSC-33S16 TaxID=2910965 RepID=UPI00209EDDDE|nr:ATP-binding protein [Okibacterium sp. HSC-33S16]MCP2030517.1 signal transduction histidine kinase [Okibacterium sp. HSC-33S16]